MLCNKQRIYWIILFSAWFLAILTVWTSAKNNEIAVLASNFVLEGRWHERRTINRPEPILTHRQELWRGLLEWCESRGDPKAINPKDRDGTPSLGGFQFKSRTFEHYRIKYKLPLANIMDYQTQFIIVGHMINDPDVNFNQEFPDCVQRYGWPPDR